MKPPNTISASKMRDLQRRARAAQRESIFSQRAVARRKADEKQRKNAGKS